MQYVFPDGRYSYQDIAAYAQEYFKNSFSSRVEYKVIELDISFRNA